MNNGALGFPHLASGLELISASGEQSSAVPLFDFSAIPQGYRDLVLMLSLRATANTAVGVDCSINGDTTTANYNQTGYYASASSGPSRDGGSSGNGGAAARVIATATGSTELAGSFGSATILISDYASPSRVKIMLSEVAYWTAMTNNLWRESLVVGWNNTSPIVRLTITPNSGAGFAVGSRARLYALR